MKNDIAPKVSLRVKFFLICMMEFIAVVLLSELAGWLLRRWLGVTLDIPIFVWAILFSVVVGGVITNYITHSFIDPITRLGAAMKEVAGGNFQITAQCCSKLKEVNDIYASFNLMVQELAATETLQTDFISSVSHEFKTPINAIEGYASLLQDHQQSTEEQQIYIEKILYNTHRLSALTGNILLLSKINNQTIKPQRTGFRLDEQIRQALLLLESRWTQKEIELDVELDGMRYTGCEAVLMQVWINLLENAIKFSVNGGIIHVRLHALPDGSAEVTIADEGEGMSPETQRHIFDKFYQGDTSHRAEGNGLGLALVQSIVRSHGGTATVESAPGAGATFTVRLPAPPVQTSV